jgi:hypothetical protein
MQHKVDSARAIAEAVENLEPQSTVTDASVFTTMEEDFQLHPQYNLPEVAPTEPVVWYAFDLDRTLAHYETWLGADYIGIPIHAMAEKLEQYLAEGKLCKIFTARVWFDRVLSDTAYNRSQNRPEVAAARKRRDEANHARRAIEIWCMRNFGVKLEVTCTKDPWCVEIWDDIARRVEPNVGPSGLERLSQVNTELVEQVAKLSAFKQFVHDTLDAAGVDKHEEQNATTGCRVGARLRDLIESANL